MQTYADYSYYRNEYLGERLSEVQLAPFVKRASAYLDQITFGRAKDAASSEAVRLACCAVADAMAQAAQSRVSSETVGNWSRAYRIEQGSARRRLYAAASLYLDGTGLLFRGVAR
ncbi:MAG: hypothetical protein RR197_06330 [Oscillospiraceae bacterium]